MAPVPTPSRRLVRTVAVLGIALPLVALAALSVASRLLGFVLGNAVFALTVVMSVGWLVYTGWTSRLVAASPLANLLGIADGADVSAEGDGSSLSLPVQALLVLTGTVVLGWVAVLTAYYLGP